MTLRTKDTRDYSLDLLRVLSILGVIAIHAITTVVVQKPIDTPVWMIGNLIDSFSRWSVPVFVIISGALMIRKSAFDNANNFLKKKMSRIIIPIIAWPLIYVLWNYVFFKSPLDFTNIIREYISGTPSPGHLYFLFIIAGLYVVTPIISLYASSVSRKQYITTTIALLVATTTWHLVTSFVPGHEYKPNAITLFIPYLGYFMLGYVINNIKIKYKWMPYFAFVFSGIVLAYLSYILVIKYGIDKGLSFYSYQSLLVIIMSFSAYVIGVDLYKLIRSKLSGQHLKKTNEILAILSSATFGVYLIHMIIFHIIVISLNLHLVSLKSALVTLLLTVILSYTASYILNRVPYARSLVK